MLIRDILDSRRLKDIVATMSGVILAFTVGSFVVSGILSNHPWWVLLAYATFLTSVGGWVIAGFLFIIKTGQRICEDFFGWFY
jgi:hypothetical protein